MNSLGSRTKNFPNHESSFNSNLSNDRTNKLNKKSSSDSSSNDKIIISARGVRFEILVRHLDCIPNSRLAIMKSYYQVSKENKSLASELFRINDLCDGYNDLTNEFFFDKDPYMMNLILNFYEARSSEKRIHLKLDSSCINLLETELESYWYIKNFEDFLEPCCLIELQKQRENLNDQIKQYNKIVDEYYHREDFGKYCFPEFRRKLWNVIENPTKSIIGKIYVTISCSMILFAVVEISNYSMTSVFFNEFFL